LTPAVNVSIVARWDQPTQESKDMGKGDKRTRKGKIFKSSYGKTRPHSPAKKAAPKPAGRKS
jgi:30S ribosomal protein S31